MTMPGFSAERILRETRIYPYSVAHGRNHAPQVRPAFVHSLPISWGTVLNWGCYENCVFNSCGFVQNKQACQAKCLNQCESSSWFLPSVFG